MTVREMAEKIIEITGSTSRIVSKELPPDDPKVRQPDIALARRVLDNWEPRIEVDEGLRRTAAYFRDALAERSAL